jgi:Fur family ferric uptake transcriptional regulator
MSQLEHQLKHAVRTNGFRLTPQRQLVLDALEECGGHCTPDQVHERVRAISPYISRATVYRTLEFLVRLGLITVAQIKDNVTVYEVRSQTPHHHLICQQCDCERIVAHEMIEPFFAQLEHSFDFDIRTDHLMLFGVCEVCRRAEADARNER